MKKLTTLILISLLSITTQRVSAQQDDYFLQTHINGQNGLPQNTIIDMVVSNSGYMWVGTEDGLVRFDGKNSQTYNTQNSCLRRNRIYQLIKTVDGKLYCLAEDDDLYEIVETGPTVSLKFLSKAPYTGFGCYHLFVATNISVFVNICKIIVPDNYQKRYQYPIFMLQDGNLIAQRYNDGLLIFSSGLQLKKRILIPDQYQKDFFVYKGLLYMRNSKGAFFFVDVETGKISSLKIQQEGIVRNTPGKVTVTDKLYWNGKTGDAFLSFNEQLYNVTVEQNKIILKKVLSSLPDNTITCILYTQKEQQLVIGTLSNGFYLYHKKQFSTMLSANDNNVYYAQTPVSNHNTMLTNRMQELGPGYQNKITQLGNYEAHTLYTDPKGNIWFGSGPTLKRYDPSSKKVKSVAYIQDNKNYYFYAILYNDTSSLLVAASSSLFYYKMDSGFRKPTDFNFSEKSKARQPFCILKESDSLVWIGTDGGLYKYNILSGQMRLDKLNGLIVRSLFKTSSGLLLAGTYGKGIYAIKENKVTVLPLDKNENLKAAHCFMEDKSGFVWISSNNGLYKITLREMDDYVAGNKKSAMFYYRFSDLDGLKTNEFNGGCFPCAVAVNSSTWSFPSMQGLVWFKPDSVIASISNSGIYIDRFILNDSVVAPPNPQTIFTQTHKFKLGIYLSSPNWGDENNLLVEYKLTVDTAMDKWILHKDINTPIVLQNLPGGNHQLIIRKRTGTGENDFKEIRLTIKVPMLLREQYWFWIVSTLAILLLLFGVNRMSNYVIKQKKEKLERLVNEKTIELRTSLQLLKVQNVQIKNSEASLKKESELKSTLLFLLSHDIASPLRFINMFLSGFAHQSKPVSITDADFVDLKISTTNLENLLDNIVAWVKNTHEQNIDPIITPVNLYQLAQEKIALFELAIKKKKNRVLNNIPINTVFYTDQFIVAMALQNLLGNAINYTKTGNIELGIIETAAEVQITVSDNGIGISNSMAEVMVKNDYAHIDHENGHTLQGYGVGLKITTELLRLINCKISLEPVKEGKGTKAILHLQKMQPLQ